MFSCTNCFLSTSEDNLVSIEHPWMKEIIDSDAEKPCKPYPLYQISLSLHTAQEFQKTKHKITEVFVLLPCS
jgi:hypothetical protein